MDKQSAGHIVLLIIGTRLFASKIDTRCPDFSRHIFPGPGIEFIKCALALIGRHIVLVHRNQVFNLIAVIAACKLFFQTRNALFQTHLLFAHACSSFRITTAAGEQIFKALCFSVSSAVSSLIS